MAEIHERQPAKTVFGVAWGPFVNPNSIFHQSDEGTNFGVESVESLQLQIVKEARHVGWLGLRTKENQF